MQIKILRQITEAIVVSHYGTNSNPDSGLRIILDRLAEYLLKGNGHFMREHEFCIAAEICSDYGYYPELTVTTKKYDLVDYVPSHNYFSSSGFPTYIPSNIQDHETKYIIKPASVGWVSTMAKGESLMLSVAPVEEQVTKHEMQW